MARVMGKFAVDQAQKRATTATAEAPGPGRRRPRLPRRLHHPARPPSRGARAHRAPGRPAPAAAKVAAKAVDGGRRQAVSAASLAIPDYDGLSASQVVNRLAGLSPVELESVQLYEAAHRGRKTILSKVAQLQGR